MKSRKNKQSLSLRGEGLKIVVTGGAGFIGSHVVDYLLHDFKNKIKQIVVIDSFTRGKRSNLKEALKSKKVKIIKGDICDLKLIDKTIKGAHYVVHEAAIKNILCDENPRLGKEVLIDGTFNVMEACVKYKVKKLVFNSSASVYGQPTKLPMKEEDSYNNHSFYGAAKIADEQLAKAFRKMYGLNYVCLRPFNVYGPRMDISGLYTEVFIKWLNAIYDGIPPLIHGDGENTLDFVYVEDVARATVAALKSSVNEGFYNVGSGTEASLNKLVGLLLKLTDSPLKPQYKSVELPFNYATRRRAYVEKMKTDLKYVCDTSLEDGLKKLITWHKKEFRK